MAAAGTTVSVSRPGKTLSSATGWPSLFSLLCDEDLESVGQLWGEGQGVQSLHSVK